MRELKVTIIANANNLNSDLRAGDTGESFICSIVESAFINSDYCITLYIVGYAHNIFMNRFDKTFNTLNRVIRYNKIEFQTGNPYNLRWQWKWKHAYYNYPKDWYEHTYVKKPEDTPNETYYGQTFVQEMYMRYLPGAKMYWNRRSRIMDPFQVYVLPSLSFMAWQFWPVSFGFKVLTILPAMLFYTRMRDKCVDPDIKETFLRDMIHNNPEIGELFKP